MSRPAQSLEIDLSILEDPDGAEVHPEDDRTPGGHRRSARLVLAAEVERRRALAQRLRETLTDERPVNLPPPSTTDDGSTKR
ncbi:MAG: hypothetical protein JRI25_17000 [Deltaproteobacteria bacterium]|nr:hypothetical protein [Deltaproteobacteria bacterium]